MPGNGGYQMWKTMQVHTPDGTAITLCVSVPTFIPQIGRTEVSIPYPKYFENEAFV